MSARFITGVLIIASTITMLSTAQVQARDRSKEIGTILGAAATLFIIGKIIEDANDDRRRPQTHRPQPQPDRWAKPPLPRHCIRWTEGRNERRVMGKGCLKRNYGAVHSLPQQCRTKFRVNGNQRRGYNVRCLRNNGYQVARRN
ncbi:MAG: hypothetical protein JXQ89_15150 [Pelagimonas sp.]